MLQARITNDEILVTGTGIELLRLKAAIVAELGSIVKSRKDGFTFPTAALWRVATNLQRAKIDEPWIANAIGEERTHANARIRALELLGTDTVPVFDNQWDTILDPPQAKAVGAMVVPGLRGLCLFDEQGSGKTVMTIAAYDLLRERGDVDTMIVACPKSMMSEWPKDLRRFAPRYNVVIAEGRYADKYNTALSDYDVLITNYEGVGAILPAIEALAEKKKYLLVVDESFLVKNEDALRSQMAGELRKNCIRCFVLCGTPAPNSSHDLVNQFNLADRGFTFGSFRISKDPHADWLPIANLMEERGLYIRRLKPEILGEVPEKNFHVVRVDLKGEQARMYEEAREELELSLRTLTNDVFRRSLTTYLQRRSVLLQICSVPAAVDPTFAAFPAKYEVLDSLVNDLVAQNRKVIIWSFFTRSIEEVVQRYSHYRPVQIHGQISMAERGEAVRAFQNDPDVMIFVGNPAAAGAGITLTAAFDAVYLSFSNQAAHYLQSLDRIHRRGQNSNEVNYYLLVCRNTIEETEVIRLRGKELNQHSLLSDSVKWPTSLDEALKELGTHG